MNLLTSLDNILFGKQDISNNKINKYVMVFNVTFNNISVISWWLNKLANMRSKQLCLSKQRNIYRELEIYSEKNNNHKIKNENGTQFKSNQDKKFQTN